MSEFVEECRREWKRLGVPDPVAREMAAELAADLDEAEADGASVEHVLGASAFDPPSFAAAWARERGLAPASGRGHSFIPRMRWLLVLGLGLAAVGMALGLALSAGSGSHAKPNVATAPAPVATTTGVSIPNVMGLTVQEAELRLRAVGLAVHVRLRGGYPRRLVVAQSPAAGSRVRPHATVSLVVAGR